MIKHLASAAVLGLLATACTGAQVSQLSNTTYTPKPEGCALEIFPSTTPSYAWQDIARVETKCHMYTGREGCMDQLRKNACEQGGDTLYDLDEGKYGEYHIIIGTVAIRDTSAPPPTEKTAPASPPPAAGCQYDNQCKGDRVCSDGECVSPATPAASPSADAPNGGVAQDEEPPAAS